MSLEKFVVSSEQMRAIEERIFQAGMPVAALMEKVAGLVVRRIIKGVKTQEFWSESFLPQIGLLIGPGHNGGDGLVIARELHFYGFPVLIYYPFTKTKDLTESHAQYARSLKIPFYTEIEVLKSCDILIDGLFGFGLERNLTPPISDVITIINDWEKIVLSIDIPSGLHTDTGAVLGTAIRATHTFCLGIWKLAFLQEQALEYLGTTELINFDIPIEDITAILGEFPLIQRMTSDQVMKVLPLPRNPASHKYKNGHLLLIVGSRRYSGAAILAGLGARASGVGMLSIAVPHSLKHLLTSQLPEALIIGCSETDNGAIRDLPIGLDFNSYNTIGIGPGLTLEAAGVVESVLDSHCPLILDADALNILAHLGGQAIITERQEITILTPHFGEFKRLFPDLINAENNQIKYAQQAAQIMSAIIILKGARVAVANPQGNVWLNPTSTPALARGGSGDVLTGLLGGLLSQTNLTEIPIESVVNAAVWWHAQGGILAAEERTELGVDAFTLTQYLIPVLRKILRTKKRIKFE